MNNSHSICNDGTITERRVCWKCVIEWDVHVAYNTHSNTVENNGPDRHLCIECDKLYTIKENPEKFGKVEFVRKRMK